MPPNWFIIIMNHIKTSVCIKKPVNLSDKFTEANQTTQNMWLSRLFSFIIS